MAGIQRSETCVLIPAYNEERNISFLAKQVMDLGFPVVVSDDGSTDNTVKEVKRLGAEVLTTDINQGKGAALRRGFEWFLNSRFPALIMIDADGQHDPRELDLFREALDGQSSDLIIGNRMGDPKGMPFTRRATNRFMSWVLSGIAKQRVPDTQCGYRAIGKEALRKIRLQTTRFEIESEMILQAARAGLKINSIPVRCVYAGEKSNIHPLRDTVRFFTFLFGYLANRKYS